jgi:hypothetical protein
MLEKNMASDKVLPCLGEIKKCNGSADFLWDELRNPCKREGYSQGTQACQLDKIFEHIGTTNKYYVEYGFNKNTQCSGSGPNTCKLWSVHGWTGLLLDGDNENLEINLHAHYLYSTNAASILKQYNVPKELDFLSGDMDSHDYFVMDNILTHFRPRVVTTEYNMNWPEDMTLSLIDPMLRKASSNSSYTFKLEGCIWGASASALKYLMESYGYELIGVATGLDLIWGRKVSPTKCQTLEHNTLYSQLLLIMFQHRMYLAAMPYHHLTTISPL